jgi:hypothetical protein
MSTGQGITVCGLGIVGVLLMMSEFPANYVCGCMMICTAFIVFAIYRSSNIPKENSYDPSRDNNL